MPYIEKPIIKKYLTIGELAAELNIRTSAIRFWQRELPSLLYCNRNDENDRRIFTQKQAQRVRAVVYLIRKGHTIQGIRYMFNIEPFNEDPEMEEYIKELIDRRS